MDNKTFHEKIAEHLKGTDTEEGKKAKSEFLDICSYTPGAYDKDEAFQQLNKDVEEKESKLTRSGQPNRLFYMALPPNVFTIVAAGLKKNCYSEKGHNRIIIEKPFGKDTESCREMMGALKGLWKEEETFRKYKMEKIYECENSNARELRHRSLSRKGNGQECVGHALRKPSY